MSAAEVPQGLPGPLPPGERILWQGRPETAGIAVRVLHIRLVGLWFLGLALWSGVPAALADGPAAAARALGPTLGAACAALALVAFLGWLSARTTTYTITNRRFVLHVGIALPMTLNLPFTMVADAGLRVFRDGSGDLPVRLRPGTRIAYLHLWPHARPWHVAEPQPMLRAVPDARTVAGILAAAIAAERTPEESALPMVVERPPASAQVHAAQNPGLQGPGPQNQGRPPRLAVAEAG
ncbi:photosynthetic complex putative assembly protein PuhB [Methylobacterium planeticum]|uniref:PH domain-containing protein n=1 Tax=Methylobacterium planeticum TaxID=2615211 RepID=A0A6N6MVA8_9HYPH|nr:photosynthetic complex putative assembly protein PuhB [Methylobacterium planeticum]KAB1074808.1 PH domain-containing protein [Methylobacterium planeticum]